jgi:hypothetical protein
LLGCDTRDTDFYALAAAIYPLLPLGVFASDNAASPFFYYSLSFYYDIENKLSRWKRCSHGLGETSDSRGQSDPSRVVPKICRKAF